jgi:hypothetical protein
MIFKPFQCRRDIYHPDLIRKQIIEILDTYGRGDPNPDEINHLLYYILVFGECEVAEDFNPDG